MKKILILGMIAFGATMTATAQTSTTASATLNVVIPNLMAIEVASPVVNIEINSASLLQDAAGTTGVTVQMPGHLKVVSNGAFAVRVSTTTPLVNGTSSISQDKINIAVPGYSSIVSGVTGELLGFTPTVLHNLGTQSTLPIISATTGTVGTLFNVDYTLAGVTGIAALPQGTYTTVVTYSISPN